MAFWKKVFFNTFFWKNAFFNTHFLKKAFFNTAFSKNAFFNTKLKKSDFLTRFFYYHIRCKMVWPYYKVLLFCGLFFTPNILLRNLLFKVRGRSYGLGALMSLILTIDRNRIAFCRQRQAAAARPAWRWRQKGILFVARVRIFCGG